MIVRSVRRQLSGQFLVQLGEKVVVFGRNLFFYSPFVVSAVMAMLIFNSVSVMGYIVLTSSLMATAVIMPRLILGSAGLSGSGMEIALLPAG